jgi:uncharacterized protein (DUF433 family)
MATASSLIERTPDVCGGDARIAGRRITVWQLVEGRRLGMSDADLLEAYPTLQAADLEAAWEYARRSPLEIERSIWENQAVMEEEGGDRRLALIVRGWQLGLPDEAVADAFSPPLSGTDLQAARQDYLARREAFDKTLAVLLPEELREGLPIHGSPAR